jgi:hypothetical protein
MKSMPCSKCSLSLVEDACHTSCDDDNALRDVNDVARSCDFICTSSANLEKENELLSTTYAKCIEEEINNLRNTTCGTCERLKSQNKVLRTRCKSLCAKSLDYHFSSL